jgi:hypothetical protein
MATTTNYGWTTPDDTALVKDGAAAIRTLGSSVDTTTKALNPSTTLGDIEYRSSTANTNTRLAIGSTGQVLTVAAGVPSWAAPASPGLNLISTTTISAGVTSQSINDVFTSTYDNYIIISALSFATWSGNLNLRLRASGSDTSTNYRLSRVYLSSGSAGFTNGANSSSATGFNFGDLNGNANEVRNFITVYKPNVAIETYIDSDQFEDDGTNMYKTFAQGSQTASTQFDGFTIFNAGSNFTGTISVYGVRK